jgi:2-succinyl-5-enolpyruvyl-6-hydroxy-3-cyclohexene-1-carboxylate synthase
MISDKKPVQDFVRLLEEHGIGHVIITPGSRNAPFSISLADHPMIKAHSIVDERSAAFIALGMARQLNKAVALICTSGTAALNFSPALAEAYYQRIPLLVVTADRPIEWIDQGEGQSIRQRDVYRNFVKASFEIAEEASEGDLVWYNVRLMDEAMRLTTDGVHGPVHINFPLRESLYKKVESAPYPIKIISRAYTDLQLTAYEKKRMSERINRAGKVMVLAGQIHKDELLHESLVDFASRPNVVILTEAHSNLAHENFITTIDRLILKFDDALQKELVPDLLITIGHNIISRKIKEFLRKGKTEHWHVDISGEGLDTVKHLTQVIPLSPADFFRTFSGNHQPDGSSGYGSKFRELNYLTKRAADQYLQTAVWSDLQAFDIICKALPPQSDLQMGNSSVVRYVLLSEARPDVRYFGNRGVAGIDGCTSTAVGAAFVTGRLTTLISGDIGFLYDSNAFWNNLVQPNLRLIVINNGGGGIFRIIEGPNSTGDILDKFFETTHTRKASDVAAMYNIPCRHAHTADELKAGLEWLYANNQCGLLEIFTPRLENDPILKDYFRAMGDSLKA